MSIETNKEKIDEILNRGIIVGVLPNMEQFLEKLLSGEKLKLYIGFDPNSALLHLSHAKNIMLLEEFRKLGHEAILLFGDFTARIGDPTTQKTARKQLTKNEVLKNVEQWKKQVKPLMNFEAKENPPKILYNSEWLSKLTFEDVTNLASNFTVQQMLERDMFEKRMKEQKPIHLHEFLYPLMQGYDSVEMGIDVELCGTDQIFNAMVGRTLLKKLKNKEKFIVSVSLMENPKTKELMSKSGGTGVFLDGSAFDMYGAIMSQPDEMIEILLINNTRLPLNEIEKIKKMENPRDAKMITALEITKIFHDEKSAKEAEEKFIKVVQKGEKIEDAPKIIINGESETLIDILKKCLPETSNSEIRRLINQKAVEIDDAIKDNLEERIEVPPTGLVIRVGKKKWFKVVVCKR